MDVTNIKRIGRTFEYDGKLWLSFSASGIEFFCNGGFTVKLVQDEIRRMSDAVARYARYAVFRNGELILDERLEQEEKTVTVEGMGTNVYRFIKLSESNESSLGIQELIAEDIRPTQDKQPKLEIIGDSITCGYGVEGSLAEVFTTATENVSKAWSYLLAEKLRADYSIVSKSGAGIISGYTGDGIRNTDNLIIPYYDKMGCSVEDIENGLNPAEVPYDFSFNPDLIILNLGTNDISYCNPVDAEGKLRIPVEESKARQGLFYSEYKKFLQELRRRHTAAKIVCILGIMGTSLNNEVAIAVQELQMAGDSRIFWHALADQTPDIDGFGTDYHPSVSTQLKLAENMYEYVTQLLR